MTDEELNARFGEMSSAITQLAQAQIQFVERMEQGQAELRQDQAELRQVVMETRADLAQLATTQSQMAQEQAELRQLVVQTRIDLAQFVEWAGIVTLAVEELREGQARHERLIERLDQRQAESDQRFEVLLEEIRFLIRQRQFPAQEEGDDT